MTIKQLHFKWTISRGRDTYGYNICSLLVDGDKVGSTCGGGYDMVGTAFAQWVESAFQKQLVELFKNDFDVLLGNPKARTYTNAKGKKVIHGNPVPTEKGFERFYGATLYAADDELPRVSLDGACGFDSIKKIAEAIGVTLKWNPESEKYKNHTYYTAIIK